MAKYLGGSAPYKNFVVKQKDDDFFLTFSTGTFTKKTISLRDTIITAEIITKENQRKFLSSTSWGFLGLLMSGGLAALASGFIGGKKARIVVACELNNGWRCALELTQKEYEALIILVPKKQNDSEILSNLRQLKELQELGILTVEEFEEKRQKLIKELIPQQSIIENTCKKNKELLTNNEVTPKNILTPNTNFQREINMIEQSEKISKYSGRLGCLTIIIFFILLMSLSNSNHSATTQPLSQPTAIQNNITPNTTNVSTPQKTTQEQLKMPKFEAIDTKMGTNLISIAAYYNDRSKENIILAARCWFRQKGNKNVFVYFVNDPTYSIDRRREETAKVLAFYESVNGGSVLYFLNPDGTPYETIHID